jgi:hypothetical protein
MKVALSILALAALTACGGGGSGGGGGGGFFVAPAATAPAADPKPVDPILQAPTVLSQNCRPTEQDNHTNCDLVPGEVPTGLAVPAGAFASFTNRTGVPLQIDQIDAFTGERQFWSEYCAYVEHLNTFQWPAGQGEVGCSAKNIGEDYPPMRWGNSTGLLVEPNQTVILNSHTEPSSIPHTYSLHVSKLNTGVQSWRQPQVDRVIPCDDQMQSTELSAWQNTTGHDMHLIGASIYAETPSSKAPNTMSGNACIYVFAADGTQKYSNCDAAIKTRGEVSFPLVTIAPGEMVAAQATNACKKGSHWNFAAFLRVW